MTIWKHRHLILYLIRHEVAARYHTALLGMLWSVLLPLSNLAIYTLVFGFIFQPRWPGLPKPTPYPLILFAGLVPYFFITDVYNQAPTLLQKYISLITKSTFPTEVLPVVLVGRALTDNLIALGLLLSALLIAQRSLSWTLLLLPLIYLPLILLSLAGAWFLASLGVYFPDSAPLVQIATRFWFFLTPVVYPLSRVPESLRWLWYLNPLTFIVERVRSTVLWDTFGAWETWLVWLVISMALCLGGYFWFEYTKEGFADVL